MTVRSDLFRREALEFRTRGETSSGSVIRLGAPWLRRSIWLLLVLLAAGLAACFLVRTNETSSGPAVVDGRDGTFSALLPVSVAGELRSAKALLITLPAGGELRVKPTTARPVTGQTAVAGLPTPRRPAILLRGRVLAGSGTTPRMHARATVVLRSERLGDVVLRQLRSMLDGGGDGA